MEKMFSVRIVFYVQEDEIRRPGGLMLSPKSSIRPWCLYSSPPLDSVPPKAEGRSCLRLWGQDRA